MTRDICLTALLCIAFASNGLASEQQHYEPSRVIYDVSHPGVEEMNNILDRAGFLQRIYKYDAFEASIVIVIHEGAIPLFASNNAQYAELMQRALSMSMGEIIQFRLCRASAAMQGFQPEDFPDFATLVPMADAEIVQLQQHGYAYLK